MVLVRYEVTTDCTDTVNLCEVQGTSVLLLVHKKKVVRQALTSFPFRAQDSPRPQLSAASERLPVYYSRMTPQQMDPRALYYIVE